MHAQRFCPEHEPNARLGLRKVSEGVQMSFRGISEAIKRGFKRLRTSFMLLGLPGLLEKGVFKTFQSVSP